MVTKIINSAIASLHQLPAGDGKWFVLDSYGPGPHLRVMSAVVTALFMSVVEDMDRIKIEFPND